VFFVVSAFSNSHLVCIVTASPAHVEALIRRSTVLLKLGKPFDALRDANAALQVEPQNANALFRKASALFELDEFEAALKTFQEGEKVEQSSRWSLWIRKCRAEIDADPSHAPATTPASATTTAPPATTSTSSTAPSVTTAPAQKIRHEWYQTDAFVIVTIFCKGLKNESVEREIEPSSLSVTIHLGGDKEWILELPRLAGEVVPGECHVDVLSTKVEVWLKKRFNARWLVPLLVLFSILGLTLRNRRPSLEAKEGDVVVAPVVPVPVVSSGVVKCILFICFIVLLISMTPGAALCKQTKSARLG
jgi:hypothetical protein